MATGSEKGLSKPLSQERLDALRKHNRCSNGSVSNGFMEAVLDSHDAANQKISHLESLLAVAVGAINSILRADVRWRSQNELMFNKQQAERESIASLLKITGLTEQDFAALGIGEGGT